MKVELVAKTTGVGKYAELNDEEIVAAIARHGVSPLDMVNYVFEIETSLSIGRQLLRHASIKPQEHSLRYAKAVGFEPIELRTEDKKNRQSSTELFQDHIEAIKYIQDWTLKEYSGSAKSLIESHLRTTENLYNALLSAGIAKECARFILPSCTTTVMSFNGTLRSWLSLLNVRMDHHAQKECRIIATLIGEELERNLPNVFSNIDWRKGMFL
jgi:thymidylate synthase (FAD)